MIDAISLDYHVIRYFTARVSTRPLLHQMLSPCSSSLGMTARMGTPVYLHSLDFRRNVMSRSTNMANLVSDAGSIVMRRKAMSHISSYTYSFIPHSLPGYARLHITIGPCYYRELSPVSFLLDFYLFSIFFRYITIFITNITHKFT